MTLTCEILFTHSGLLELLFSPFQILFFQVNSNYYYYCLLIDFLGHMHNYLLTKNFVHTICITVAKSLLLPLTNKIITLIGHIGILDYLLAFSSLLINIMYISTGGSIFGSLILGHYI